MELTIRKVYIYSLSCPKTEYIKYIGKAEDALYRYKKHIEESLRGKNTKKCKWIKSLINNGLNPILNIEDIVNENEWIFWEKYYISLYKSFGFDLKNGTNGGDGGKMNNDIIEKIREKAKKRPQTEHQKQTVKKLMMGNKHAIGGKSRSKKIECKNIKTGGSISFNSITEAAEILKIKRTTIGNNLSGLNNIVSNRFKFNYSC